ncbi:putative ATP synthase YscN [Caprobacter fermentans]|uniref:Putative ATP synthase YscN n=1 Tax=Caproicibacter fermentans TaxID=2576756 RepID=A0A6N8HVC8_9FIRM|nr:flagellar protein export ATPase FliI [Caproicibacter fermentans]MVB09736.1 putative ATP synthase YscN [Caproicibacter fermentans]OCN03144.1 flagellar protein export ATPase FliI [Clostridium sp. W14A]
MVDLRAACEIVTKIDPLCYKGKVKNIVGMMIETTGLDAKIGDICTIGGQTGGPVVEAEAVGFRDGNVLLMSYGDIRGVGPGSIVESTGHKLRVPVGECLKGRTVDAAGNPIDSLGDFEPETYYDVESSCVNPLDRPRISETMTFGIKAIDGALTIGKGQRVGIFAGSGVGKSTLMGMIAKNVKSDINVIALVGERGREVKEFIEKDLGEEGLARSVLVVATSDQPAMLRAKCAFVATAIAEYFRDRGEDVLLMMDSLTRFAMAQREIGLATGEPPIARGYTPSIYSQLPRLLERSGNFMTGSITGIYTVLVEGDDTNEPISDTVRGILDGHIVLSRTLAAKNHYPAIDVGASISRLMTDITSEEHQASASRLRNLLSVYNQNYDLISIGAYKPGMNKRLDEAVGKIDGINRFLMQRVDESFSYEETENQMKGI